MVNSHRNLNAGAFATGLQHMLEYLGSILRIALTPYLATADDYRLGGITMLMYRHIRIRHHLIDNALRHIVPVFMSDASGSIGFCTHIVMHTTYRKIICKELDCIEEGVILIL
jgi:hypothetical protein